MCGKNLLLLSLFCLHGLCAEQQPQSCTMESINLPLLSLRPQGEINLWNLSNSTGIPLLGYSMMLSQYGQNYNPLLNEPPNSNSESSELLDMLNSQMQNLLSLETQWQALETHYKTLSTYNRELLNLLDESKKTIAQLRWNLECALERVQDAEDGAIALLDENAEIFKQARLAVANIANMQRGLAKSRRGTVIGWTVGSVSFGVGTPLIVEGIRSDNRAMLWSGISVTGVASIVWATGHFFFEWW